MLYQVQVPNLYLVEADSPQEAVDLAMDGDYIQLDECFDDAEVTVCRRDL